MERSFLPSLCRWTMHSTLRELSPPHGTLERAKALHVFSTNPSSLREDGRATPGSEVSKKSYECGSLIISKSDNPVRTMKFNADASEKGDATQPYAVPWYLQSQGKNNIPYPNSNRQKIPQLPSKSPALLRDLIDYASVDLGLDDLELYDLRELDQPSALGSNLIMLLGTARSEKHLHVSADRTCRWLRTRFRLSPFADGLLGRNELKVRLRRKARRATLLGNVGAHERAAKDESVRSGWICVNVDIEEETEVEIDRETEDVSSARPASPIGFGSGRSQIRVVIQMMTQEKRETLDLESLWGAKYRTQEHEKMGEGVFQP